MQQLRKTMSIPFGLPIPTAVLKIGAKIIGTETELVLKSRNVIPDRLLKNGFKFEFDNLNKTFLNLIAK